MRWDVSAIAAAAVVALGVVWGSTGSKGDGDDRRYFIPGRGLGRSHTFLVVCRRVQ